MSTVKNISSVSLRTARLEDYAQIVELETQYGLESKTPEDWKHLWLNNPIYRLLAKSWTIGWVLEDSSRKIVGYLGNIPLSYEFEGKELLAATGRAWVVDSRYRSYSLLLMDHLLAQKNVDLYINTTLNALAFEGFQFFGPLPVPVGDWDRSRFWVTKPAGFLASSFAVKGFPFAKFLSYPLSVPLLVKDHFTGRRFGQDASHVNVESCSGFDERFDTFWEDLKRSRSHVLLGTRTREILDWHFGPALSANNVWIFSANDGSRLAAYSIFCRQDNAKLGLKRVRLVDFQALTNDHNSLLVPMLHCALERCQSVGIHMLEVMGLSPEKKKLIEELAPYQRKLSAWRCFYKANNPGLAQRLKDPNVWDPSLFDGDSTL